MDCRQLSQAHRHVASSIISISKGVQHFNQIDFFEMTSYSLENEEGRQPEFLLVSFIAVGSIIIIFFEIVCLKIKTP